MLVYFDETVRGNVMKNIMHLLNGVFLKITANTHKFGAFGF